MQLEFHQLDRRWEHLRVRHPERQKRLLASLASVGQQTPIVVVAVANQPERYLVIDGYQRLAALEQLGRDTVEAVVWPLSEAQALVLDRSLRWSPQDSALEEGWLLAELEQQFGYRVEELARQFDRSVSWVARRLALVELLPESVQQQVRQGQISAQMAMKYLVPVARASLEDCRKMAAALAQHHFSSRQARQLYEAWRGASPKIRQRILEQPQLFLKAQRQPAPSPVEELVRDLERVTAIARRANRQLLESPTALELMDRESCEQAREALDRAMTELGRLAAKLPQEVKPREEEEHVEPKSASHDSAPPCPGGEETGDRAPAGHLSSECAQGGSFQLCRGASTPPCGEGRALPATDPGVAAPLQEESRAGP